jgi:hypothetical protein
MRKHFVTFLSPGTFFDESTVKEIPSWDTTKAVKMAGQITERYGAMPYGFRFSTSIVSKDIPDGEGGKLKVKPKEVKRSGIYFLGCYLETLDQVEKRADPKEETLLWNMRVNGMFVICINTNSYKSVHKFGEEDVLLDGYVPEYGNSSKWTEYRKETKKRIEKENSNASR